MKETSLPNGFEWCEFNVDTKNEDELSAILDELVEFLKANYFQYSRQENLVIKNFLKW